jgi:hypothetical protein
MATNGRLAVGMTVRVLEDGKLVDTAIITAFEDGEKIIIRSLTTRPGQTIRFGFTGVSPRTEGWRHLREDPMAENRLVYSQRGPTYTFEEVQA